ncbi:hypothetical protein [Leptospira dzoumogneensis]|uniref:Uncharacterized protein n=1 Tax=Leptospira dzoumogneensis TaxID=2484904 RepID=A0A4Z1AKZ8_9LEPT|nr:hypothetical protein [Leptospira dzoumogneensis]TGN00010.1 hypothetical protein EHR06_07770 [Leptospira dzoumogneensis]
MSKRKPIDRGYKPYTQSAYEDIIDAKKKKQQDPEDDFTNKPGHIPRDDEYEQEGLSTPLKKDILERLASRQSVVLAIWVGVISALVFFITISFSINTFLAEVKSSINSVDSNTKKLDLAIEKVNNRLDMLIDKIFYSSAEIKKKQ